MPAADQSVGVLANKAAKCSRKFVKNHSHLQLKVLLTGASATYQGSTAEQDHEDDEGLEPAVFHNLVAGFPQPPPGLTQTAGDVDITAVTVSDTN